MKTSTPILTILLTSSVIYADNLNSYDFEFDNAKTKTKSTAQT